MSSRVAVLALIVIILIVVVAAIVTYPMWQPISADDAFAKAFPVLTAQQLEGIRALPEVQRTALLALGDINRQMAQDIAAHLIEPDIGIGDILLPNLDIEPPMVATGTFSGFDVIFNGAGTATIYEVPPPMGGWALHLNDFRVSNGPDLHVLLSVNMPQNSTDGLEFGSVDLGSLRGNVGSLVYSIPADVDMARFSAVVIWCQPYAINYTAAEITAG